ncbi:NAD(P)-binding protein [Pholiota conissans]|uniref:NAD(P)-binding protein n=1 Tax=Pholiota conissans TaxID=109636 RepID=A0A9P5YQP3_9AGAR|nr:NAD(P)-binding protein [Pholiota conissans]
MSESSKPKIYLVAGATRGLGLAFVETIASRDSTAIIYAGGRNPSSSPQLVKLAEKYPGRIECITYVAGDKEGNDAMARAIKAKYGRVDTVIANAGINNRVGQIHELSIETYNDYFSVNVLGPIVLFQSVRGLLSASTEPRFICISSGRGSLELISRKSGIDMSAYGMSKAALNWVTRKIHFENEWLVSFPICPGPVYTDMAKEAIASDETGTLATMKDVWRPPNVVAEMILDIVATSTRDKDGGQFHNESGGRYPW